MCQIMKLNIFFQTLIELYQEVTKFTSLGQALDLISAGIEQHLDFYF